MGRGIRAVGIRIHNGTVNADGEERPVCQSIYSTWPSLDEDLLVRTIRPLCETSTS
jgi:hypothetical protein